MANNKYQFKETHFKLKIKCLCWLFLRYLWYMDVIKLQNIGGTKTDIADLHSYLNNMLIKDEKAKSLKKVI